MKVGDAMKKAKTSTLALAFISGLAASGAQAFSTTVSYPLSESVGPFDTYDFAPGVVAMNIDTSGNVTGEFQSYVTSHQLGSVLVPSTVNTNYEVTVYGTFTGVSSTSGPVVNFNLTGGSFNIYYDPSIDRNFTGTGSGFTDGTPILTGNITGGTGSYVAGPVNAGFSLVLSGLASPVSPAAFSPFPPAGESIFGLSLGSLPAGATGVGSMNNPQILIGGDGNLRFVPVPAAAWLLGPALLGGMFWQRRRQVA